MAEQVALDETKLGATSRALLKSLLQISAAFRDAAKMEVGSESDGYSVVIDLRSPTGDESRILGVWVDETGVPSVEFGSWHSHGDVLSQDQSRAAQIAAVVDVVAAILRDEFVVISDVGGEYPGHTSVLDLRDPDALAEELTRKYSPGCVLIKSWTGRRDQEAGLHNTRLE